MNDKKNTVALHRSMKELQLEKKVKDLEERITSLESMLAGIVAKGSTKTVDGNVYDYTVYTRPVHVIDYGQYIDGPITPPIQGTTTYTSSSNNTVVLSNTAAYTTVTLPIIK
jgi:hypothetical protein